MWSYDDEDFVDDADDDDGDHKVSIQRVEWESTQKQIEMKEKILLLLGDHKVSQKQRFGQNSGEKLIFCEKLFTFSGSLSRALG